MLKIAKFPRCALLTIKNTATILRAFSIKVEWHDEHKNQIYRYGPLLHTVQMARIFKDSKTFVDMKLKNNAETTAKNFEVFMKEKDNTPNDEELLDFVYEHFEELGTEFEPWIPDDWNEHPKFLDTIVDPDLRQWAIDLNAMWKDLGRKLIDDVHKHPECYSIIPVKNPVIVPGGRFIEFYYWDSYWIIRGLLICEMNTTARGMLENYISIVQRYGYIPNGGRIYYLNRSHPPLLPGMIQSYVKFTKDEQFGINSLEILEYEFEYWMNKNTVQAKGYNMAIYSDSSPGPRPESYREDVEISRTFPTEEDRENYYSEIKAAAASGMDFTSRWFINHEGDVKGDLTHIKARSIVPVELNCILYCNAQIIAELHKMAGNVAKMSEYELKAQKILEAVTAVHWNEEEGAWLDYDLKNNRPRKYWVTTNLSPLWMKVYNRDDSERISEKVLQYIENHELDKYPGGVPNTLYKTGQQWDYPNVWPPMQYMLIEGLETLGTPKALELSKKWAHRWVMSNFAAYRKKGAMFEKYDAERFGGRGGGGEYEIQTGFGWTNGIIIEYLLKHGHEISLSDCNFEYKVKK